MTMEVIGVEGETTLPNDSYMDNNVSERNNPCKSEK